MKSALPLLAVLLIVTAGCGGARPYRAMARAATSEEDVFAQAQDKELKIQLREALLARGESSLAIRPYVYMERGFVVGFVGDGAERDGVLSAAQGVPGLRSLQSYLPDRPATSSTADDVATKANVKAALVPHREIGVTHVDIEVLAGHVVLLGVVGSEEARESAVTVAAGVSGVKGVTNFLLLPEPDYESLRPHLR
ncbi:MAG TPA: BON domain-containing protein [Candidatus Methylomirabilis sp.]|nr:BON domain-containing protein [Candidatus Methylomirabilis sp.]